MLSKKNKQIIAQTLLIIMTSHFSFSLIANYEDSSVELLADNNQENISVICQPQCIKQHISINNFCIDALIFSIVEHAQIVGTENNLSTGILDCYESLKLGYKFLHIDSLKEALPELLEAIQYFPFNDKAPRPDAEPNSIVSPGTCDLTQVIRLLKKIDEELLLCCENINFNNTFTCCAEVTNGFNGTFTVLADLKATISADFNQTWTILNSILDSATCACTNALSTNTTVFAINELLNASLCSPTLISQSTFGPGGTTPLVLSSSGAYILTQDITYNPLIPGTSAITIAASEVFLDLTCFTIRQGNTVPTTNGISINPNVTDITIKNGIIKDFSDSGIESTLSNQRVNIHDILIIDSGYNGISLSNIFASSIDNVEIIQSSTATDAVAQSAIELINPVDFKISDCFIHNNGGGTATSWSGVLLSGGTKVKIEDVQVNDNSNPTIRAIDLVNTSVSQINSCEVVNNVATNLLQGISINTSPATKNFIRNCLVLNNRSINISQSYFVDTSCNSNSLMQCESSDNLSINQNVAFLLNNNSKNNCFDCISKNDQILISAVFPTIGFDLNTTTSCQLIRCYAFDQIATMTSIGIRVLNGGGNEIKECQVLRDTIGYQLDPINSTNSVFIKNIAAKNRTNYNQFPVGSTDSAPTISNLNSLKNPWTNIEVG